MHRYFPQGMRSKEWGTAEWEEVGGMPMRAVVGQFVRHVFGELIVGIDVLR